MTACTDVFEEDLAGMTVALTAPTDGWQGAQNTITFRWEEVPGADHYQVQIASPDFEHYLDLAVDTQLTALQLSVTLVPDSFVWRVRGMNGSSTTIWSTRRFIISTNGDLTGLNVPLVSPGANAQTRDNDLLFIWLGLPDAEQYVFQLHEGNWAGAVLFEDTVNVTSATALAIPEGAHTWGVQALNTISATEFALRIVTIDQTAPIAPVLLSPTANATLGDSLVQFSWTPGSDALSSTIDSMFLFPNGSSTPLRSLATSSGSHTEVLEPGSYTWSVRCYDGAGNNSSTTPRAFSVQ